MVSLTEAPSRYEEAGGELGLYLRLLRWSGLIDWERGFVSSLYDRYPAPLTEKQSFHLYKIIRKYLASHDAA